jgi:hypothetical protein
VGRAIGNGTWHVHFNEKPEVLWHICDDCRAVSQQIGCRDAQPDGDCIHVQHRRCNCTSIPVCEMCWQHLLAS